MVTIARPAESAPLMAEALPLSRWPIRLRWLAAAGLLAAAGAASAAGAQAAVGPLILVAAFILLCNLFFHRHIARRGGLPAVSPAARRRLAGLQAAADAAAIWGVMIFTGGSASPLAVAFLIPVLWLSIHLPGRGACLLCAAILAAVCLTVLAETARWLPQPTGAISGSADPMRALVRAGILAGVLFAAAAICAAAVRSHRQQVLELENVREAAAAFSRKLQGVFSILETIGSVRHLGQVLETAVSEVAVVMQVKGVSVKLLSEDGKFLRYAAAFGLPETMVREKLVEVERSPLNRRVIDGEPFVTGQVTAGQMFQFGETLSAAHIRSVLFVPLHIDSRVIGILGAYCEKSDRFSAGEVDFFRQTARLVAIALDNARAYEAIQKMGQERTWFMMKVAHNLRTPLVAMLSILEVVREGYLGAINEEQSEYLRRLDRRARTMLTMINDLMALSRNRELRTTDPDAATDPSVLARRIQRTFQDKAAERRIAFCLSLPPDVPHILGRLETVEQILENLVSNAIKYTPPEGRVEIAFARADGTVRIEVSDTGIGIGAEDRPRLFSEFFRSEKAKAMEELGTGLGLAIVKEFVDKLAGRILVESEEGVGTIFVVHLPAAPAAKEARP